MAEIFLGIIKGEKGDKGDGLVTVDQTYKPYSENPQSGKAVKQALESLPTVPKVIHVMSVGTSNELPDALEWFEAHPMSGSRYDAMTHPCLSEPILFVDDNGGWTFYIVDYHYVEMDIDNIDESATWVELKFAKADDVPKVDSQYGISMDYNKNLKIAPATNSVIMESTEQYKPITPKYLGYGVGCHGIVRLSTMPSANSTHLNWIVLYTGETDSTYTKNKMYVCVNEDGYKWVEFTLAGLPPKLIASTSYGTMIDAYNYIAVYPAAESTIKEGVHPYQPVSVKNFGYAVGCNGIVRLSTMPTAASKYLGWIVLYTGETDATYTKNQLYECVNDGGYKWTKFETASDTETWTFTLEDGSTVTKTVVLK